MCVYACYNIDDNIRLKSSSGGVFSLLAEDILRENGVVYGVAMSEDCYYAEFIRVVDIENLEKLRGSKYLQARMGNVFLDVKEDLSARRKVLFSGTGCQINGLKKFLKKEYDNLFCVDVICHGVPSPELWKKYVLYQESKNGKMVSVNFRCKDITWKNFGIKENKVFISKDVNFFMQMFLKNYCLRPSCYNCIAKDEKMSDITIADFWGIENVAPEMDDEKGTSLIIIRTNKGRKFFKRISNGMKEKEVSYEDAIKGNSSEYSSVKRPVERSFFFGDLHSMDFAELEKKYSISKKVSFVNKIKWKIKRIFKNSSGGDKRKFWKDYGMMLTFINGDSCDE